MDALHEVTEQRSKPQILRNNTSGILVFDYSCKSFGTVRPDARQGVPGIASSRLMA